MRTLATFFLLSLATITFASDNGGAPASNVCLVMRGSFGNAFYKDNRPCTVEVMRDGAVLDTLTITRMRRKFTYVFDGNCCYTLRVTKPGFAPMLIAVDTRHDLGEDFISRFDFDAHLITEKRAATFDSETLQLPYAQIVYSETHGGFMIDEGYTDQVKAQMVFRGKR